MSSDILRGRRDESHFIRESIEDVNPIRHGQHPGLEAPWEEVLEIMPVTRAPLRAEQWRLIFTALGGVSSEAKNYLREISSDPRFHGVSNGQILLEYTTAVLTRELCELEITWHRQGKIPFAIPGFGHELVGVAIERHLRQSDAVYPYYRQEANDLMRGGTVKELLLLTAQKKADPHSGGRILAGHPASGWKNELPVISNVGAHTLTSVGIAQGLKLRRTQGKVAEAWKRFNAPDAISVCHVGDASMAEGEVGEALQEAVKDGGCPFILVVHNNGSGISTDVREGSVAGDPIALARGLAQYGLKIIEVDGTNVQEVYDACREAVEYARERGKPALVHVYGMYKRFHSSSDDPARYLSSSALAKKQVADPLPRLRAYLLENEIADAALLDRIKTLAHGKVLHSGKVVLATADPNPDDLYHNLHAPQFPYGEVGMKQFHPQAADFSDLLPSSRQRSVEYLRLIRTDTQPLNMRQHLTVVLAEEMKRDDRIILFGEDVADFSTETWNNFTDYLEQRLDDRAPEFTKNEIAAVLQASLLVAEGKGNEIEAKTFSLLVDLLGGKGGVFKTTQFLQILFGRGRVWNSRLAEASIVGTAIGYALGGFVPVVEIQFDSYWSPAYQQIVDQLATMRWRSNGQFGAGLVIRIQGMNRLGGVGGIGHGNVILGRLAAIPGIRVVTPADASEAGPLLRESIRLAQEHDEPVIFLEPIMELNTSFGHYQGKDARIPLGEAQVRQEGKDFVVLTYGNNIPLVEKAQEEWGKMGISATIINLRTLGVATDWATIVPWIEKLGKVMILETERKTGSAGADLSAGIAEHFFPLLDAPVKRLSARDIPTAAGKLNEEYELPQIKDIIRAGKELAEF